jgi:hypothetical protein
MQRRDLTPQVRASLEALTAADPASQYPVDLLDSVRHARLKRGFTFHEPVSPDFVRHMEVVWDAQDLITDQYGEITDELIRALAAQFGEMVPVEELRDGDVFEDGGWVGGHPPASYIAWTVYLGVQPGRVVVALHMTGTRRVFWRGTHVHVLKRLGWTR